MVGYACFFFCKWNVLEGNTISNEDMKTNVRGEKLEPFNKYNKLKAWVKENTIKVIIFFY